MGKLKKGNVDIGKIADNLLNTSPPDATKPSVMWNDHPDLYTVKC